MLLATLIGLARASEGVHEVLVLHAADPTLVEAARARIMRPGLLRDTDAWDLRSDGVPAAADLAPYDAVLLWLDEPAPDPDLLGDRLATFVDDRGGALVLAGATCSTGVSPRGRLSSAALLPWTPGSLGGSSGQRAVRSGPDHDLHGALGVVDAGTSPRCTGLVPRAGVPLAWDDGAPLVAVHPTRRVAGVNLWPPDTAASAAGWATTGHGDQVLARALMWSAGFDWPNDACRRDTAEGDRNCNGLLRSQEPLVDLSDPVCQATLDPDGHPYTSFDDYIEPETWGCELAVHVEDDWDADGLGDGEVALFVDPHLWWGSWVFSCDGCPLDPDPLQFDLDCDEAGDLCDLCPYSAEAGDTDRDIDGIPDACDNCPPPQGAEVDPYYNPNQDNEDGDHLGNVCDRCPFDTDPLQPNRDGDELGDACDPCPDDVSDDADADGDGFGDVCDLCPGATDPDQTDIDQDLVGDACDVCPLDGRDGVDQADSDGDGVGDLCDTCPDVADTAQTDTDQDGVGDACDRCPKVAHEQPGDLDRDSVLDACDVCIRIPNRLQHDRDQDGVGDACDLCPTVYDPEQLDLDDDSLGDACDTVWLRGGGALCGGSACDGGAGEAGLGPAGLALGFALVGRRRHSPAPRPPDGPAGAVRSG